MALNSTHLDGAGESGAARRRRLDRGAIVTAAVALIEREGLSALSMRLLGADLGVQAMALYRYVPSRNNLIDAVIELVIDELYADPEVFLEPVDGWQDYLERLAHGIRRMAIAHPRLFPLMATRPAAALWVRPPLRSLRWIESFLSGLRAEGFTDDGAVYAYRAFTGFLLGHLLLEVAAMGVEVGPADDVDPVHQETDPLLDYPTVTRLSERIARGDPKKEFDDSLANLMRRLREALSGDAASEQVTGAGGDDGRLPRARGGNHARSS